MYASRHYLLGLAAFAFMAFGFIVSQVAMDGQLSQVSDSAVFGQPCNVPPPAPRQKAQGLQTPDDIRFVEFQLSEPSNDVSQDIESFR